VRSFDCAMKFRFRPFKGDKTSSEGQVPFCSGHDGSRFARTLLRPCALRASGRDLVIYHVADFCHRCFPFEFSEPTSKAQRPNSTRTEVRILLITANLVQRR
jgi:hypothetical protein